jgi:3-dehydrotetronate 4-kinase
MLIGAIADDLSGATDLGLMFARSGLRVLQCNGVPCGFVDLADAQAIIVALKTRTVPPAEAVAQSLSALKFLSEAGADKILFKYCSTFDSTDQGNIGPVIDALMTKMGERRTIACPAMPQNGRTVYQGHLFVGSQLLSDSSMKNHPLTPMRDANLVQILQRQTERHVSLVSYPVVASGGPALESALCNGEGIAIVDAISEDDLLRLGIASRALKLITGGSGIGLGVAANFPTDELTKKRIFVTPAPGAGVVLAGSCSEATRRQLAEAKAAAYPSLRITPSSIANGTLTVGQAIAFACGVKGDEAPIIYSSAAPEEIAEAQEALGPQVAGAIVEDFLAEVALGLLGQGFTRFIVAGGETSGAVTQALGAATLTIGPEIDPGVPWTTFRHKGRDIALALKSGNFGADDFLTKAWNLLA